jgi:hypothetical protein
MDAKPIADFALDRRGFLGGAGGAVVAATLPAWSLVPAGPVAAAVTGPELVGDWSIDDQWSGYPRYAEAIGGGRPEPARPPEVHLADAPFIPF